MADAICLPAKLDTVALRDLCTDLTRALGERELRLDAGDVTHMGALGAQMILAAARDLRACGGAFEIVAISDRARDQLAMMGLSPDFSEDAQ